MIKLEKIVAKLIFYIVLLLSVAACSKTNDPYENYRNGNYEVAIKQLEKLAKQGDLKATTHLGVMYQLGLGTNRDLTKAVKLYGQAADANHAAAQYNLGLVLYQGIGVEQNKNEAYIMFKRAAKQGHAKAQQQLDYMLSYTEVNQYQLKQN